ncbi:tetratricopeptide repeat protein [Stigmatella ashevillensis]|uniref:tetratricopeptide repeat protein n=1 Tax=Stigmatella ashevillensis TaxID=2995309 RepID=UPI00358DCFD2
MEAWRRAVSRKPDSLEAGFNLGLALERLGRPEEAARTYEALLHWHPNEPLVRSRLAQLRDAVRHAPLKNPTNP